MTLFFLLLLILLLDLIFFDARKILVYGALFIIGFFGRIAYEFINAFLELNPIIFLMILPFVYYYALA
jgi:hypothetical protein